MRGEPGPAVSDLPPSCSAIRLARSSCFRSFSKEMLIAFAFALASAGSNSADENEENRMTTRTSTSLDACNFGGDSLRGQLAPDVRTQSTQHDQRGNDAAQKPENGEPFAELGMNAIVANPAREIINWTRKAPANTRSGAISGFRFSASARPMRSNCGMRVLNTTTVSKPSRIHPVPGTSPCSSARNPNG